MDKIICNTVNFNTNAINKLSYRLNEVQCVVSDINRKENLIELKHLETLEKIESMPIYQYNYKETDKGLLCRGPVAQDWNKAFPSAKDPLMIDTMDLDGITLSAVKGLTQLVRELQKEVAELKAQINNK